MRQGVFGGLPCSYYSSQFLLILSKRSSPPKIYIFLSVERKYTGFPKHIRDFNRKIISPGFPTASTISSKRMLYRGLLGVSACFGDPLHLVDHDARGLKKSSTHGCFMAYIINETYFGAQDAKSPRTAGHSN